MSRQERVDVAALAVILITLLLFAGSMLPATAAVQQSATTDAISTASELVESELEPSGIRGLTIAELHADAQATIDSLPATAPSGQYTMVSEYAASYDGAPPEFPATYFTLESSNFPGVFHVFHSVATQRA